MTASPEWPRAHLSQTRSSASTVPGQAFTFLAVRAIPWAAGSALFSLTKPSIRSGSHLSLAPTSGPCSLRDFTPQAATVAPTRVMHISCAGRATHAGFASNGAPQELCWRRGSSRALLAERSRCRGLVRQNHRRAVGAGSHLGWLPALGVLSWDGE